MLPGILNDPELVAYAESLASSRSRDLQVVLVHGNKDCTTYLDIKTEERRTLPNKYIRALGPHTAFELVQIGPEDLTPTETS